MHFSLFFCFSASRVFCTGDVQFRLSMLDPVAKGGVVGNLLWQTRSSRNSCQSRTINPGS